MPWYGRDTNYSRVVALRAAAAKVQRWTAYWFENEQPASETRPVAFRCPGPGAAGDPGGTLAGRNRRHAPLSAGRHRVRRLARGLCRSTGRVQSQCHPYCAAYAGLCRRWQDKLRRKLHRLVARWPANCVPLGLREERPTPTLRCSRRRRSIAGKQREVVVAFSPQLQDGQLRGLQQSMARSRRELEELGLHPRGIAEAAERKLARICGRQYLRSVLRHSVDRDAVGAPCIRVWSDRQE